MRRYFEVRCGTDAKIAIDNRSLISTVDSRTNNLSRTTLIDAGREVFRNKVHALSFGTTVATLQCY